MATTVEYTIKQHDLLPDLVVTLLDGTTPVDLTTAESARLLVRNLSGLKVNALMAIMDQTVAENIGKVVYTWTGTDTDTVASYNAEVEIIWPGARPQTFPSAKTQKYFKVTVLNDLTD